MALGATLTETDRKILSCLQRDPRSSVANMAELTGIPQSTLRHRLNRMLTEGIVEMSAVVNPLLLENYEWAMIALKVPLSQVEAVSLALAELSEVIFVGSTTGAYNLLVGVVLGDETDLGEFMLRSLSKFEHIHGLYTFNILKIYKRSFLFKAA